MKKPVQVIPLQELLGAPLWWRLWCPLRIWAGGLEKWHWCLMFALCTSLVGGILLLCSINPYGTIAFLVLPGILYPLELLSPNTRRYQAVEVLIVNYSALGITALAFAFYNSHS
jgi:hypothetical protein